MIKYRAEMYYAPKIEKIEIERETAYFVWINGRRERKDSMGSKVFETFDDAKTYILDMINGKIDYHESEVKRLKKMFATITCIKNEDI
jgi:hypothetical protein